MTYKAKVELRIAGDGKTPENAHQPKHPLQNRALEVGNDLLAYSIYEYSYENNAVVAELYDYDSTRLQKLLDHISNQQARKVLQWI